MNSHCLMASNRSLRCHRLKERELTFHFRWNEIFATFLSVQLIERCQIVVEFGFDQFRFIVFRAHDFGIDLQAFQTVVNVTGQRESSGQLQILISSMISMIIESTYLQNNVKLSSTLFDDCRASVMFLLKSPCRHIEISLSTQ